MTKYRVVIEETNKYEIEVEADTSEQAKNIASQKWIDGEVDDDFKEGWANIEYVKRMEEDE